ncbi:MAG: MauE/DoxX family redox-associated membrane protein [Dehalococcoidia bacterium]|jgi:uncharacterized membrane protein YphA (DoxX/SURF4 family)
MKRLTELLQNAYLHLALRLFLGFTFIVSAVSKLPMQTGFIDVVKSYHMLPDSLAYVYGAALPWLELLIGVYLLLGILLRINALATLLISATFMVANIGAIVQGKENCGTCFGESLPLPVEAALAYDFVIIIAAVVLLVHGHITQKFSVEEFFIRRAERVEVQAESESVEPADGADVEEPRS